MINNTVISSLFKLLAFTLIIAVLSPSVIKLTHAFTHHEHVVCSDDNEQKTHIHESDIDCEFYKFKLTKQYYFLNETERSVTVINNYKISDAQYVFISEYQKRHTSLRGPPQLI